KIPSGVAPHAVRDNPDPLVRQGEDAVLVEGAHPADMGERAVSDRTHAHTSTMVAPQTGAERSKRPHAAAGSGRPPSCISRFTVPMWLLQTLTRPPRAAVHAAASAGAMPSAPATRVTRPGTS